MHNSGHAPGVVAVSWSAYDQTPENGMVIPFDILMAPVIAVPNEKPPDGRAVIVQVTATPDVPAATSRVPVTPPGEP